MSSAGTTKRPRGRPRKHPLPVPAPFYPDDAPMYAGPPDERLLVTIHFPRRSAAFGDPDTKSSVEVPWPKDWPLPQPGSRLVVGERSGFVEYVTFDPAAGKLSVNTR